MQQEALIIIRAGKSALNQLYQENRTLSQDDVIYISQVKTMIHGLALAGSDNITRHQIKQALLTVARDLYVQLWMINENDQTQDTYQEGLHWFDYIYDHGQYPE